MLQYYLTKALYTCVKLPLFDSSDILETVLISQRAWQRTYKIKNADDPGISISTNNKI